LSNQHWCHHTFCLACSTGGTVSVGCGCSCIRNWITIPIHEEAVLRGGYMERPSDYSKSSPREVFEYRTSKTHNHRGTVDGAKHKTDILPETLPEY